MCGIAGNWNAYSGKWNDKHEIIEEMLSTIHYRGPDDKGAMLCGAAEIGIRRLSIIDLKTGVQPINNGYESPGELWIVFNGTLFNYIEIRKELESFGVHFKTQSDTEVVLRAYEKWGEHCLDKFIGQWAFCILHVDVKSGQPKKMFICRDRMGEKPLYYYHKNGRFLFASEIKAILPFVDTEPNIGDEFWAFETSSYGETFFKDIHELPSAHYMTFDGEKTHFHKYWEIPNNRHLLTNENDLSDELLELLRSSVKLRLRSDVPVGVALSGGVDSAAIACLAEPDSAFSCRFPLGPKFDEFEYAQIVAKHIGCNHHVVMPDHEDFRKSIQKIVWYLDQPLATASPIGDFAVSKDASDRGVKVLLGGQGSDECFGGYIRYLVFLSENRLREVPELANYHSMMRYFWGSQKLFTDPATRYFKLLCRGNCELPDVHAQTVNYYFRKQSNPIDAMGYTDMFLTLPSLITMNDRSASAYGIENRSPFLDHRLIEFAFKLPPEMKIKEYQTKYLLKKALRGIVPDPILDRRDKKGLIVPFGPWMNKGGPLSSWAAQLVDDVSKRIKLPANLCKRGEFDRSTYTLVTLEFWFRNFFPEYRCRGEEQKK